MESMKEYWNIDQPSAALLQAIVHVKKPMNILEVGTSNGYSAIQIGKIASLYGGNITSIEFFGERFELAKANIAKEGLSKTIEILQGDALEIMSQLALSPRPGSRNDNLGTHPQLFDFIFLDANKQEYVLYFNYAMQIIQPGGIIVADNTISHANKLTEFFTAVEKEPRAHAHNVSIGAGLMLITID